MPHPVKGSERAINRFLAVAQLLKEPRLAGLYTFVLREGEVAIDDIVDALEMSRTTAYSDASTLVELGVLTRDDDRETHTYSAVPISLTVNATGAEYTVTPTLIEAFARSADDRDLDLLLEKHGPGKLAAAVMYAVPYAEGEMSERAAARELGLQQAFAVAVLQALREVVLDMQTDDPYFEEIPSPHKRPPEVEE